MLCPNGARLKMATPEWHWEQGIKYAVEGIKTSLLLNGAAAIALMTFANTHEAFGGMKLALFLFSLGAIVSAIAFMGAYYSQLNYGNAEVPGPGKDGFWRKGQNWNKATAIMVVASVAIFFGGSLVLLFSWPATPSSSPAAAVELRSPASARLPR